MRSCGTELMANNLYELYARGSHRETDCTVESNTAASMPNYADCVKKNFDSIFVRDLRSIILIPDYKFLSQICIQDTVRIHEFMNLRARSALIRSARYTYTRVYPCSMNLTHFVVLSARRWQSRREKAEMSESRASARRVMPRNGKSQRAFANARRQWDETRRRAKDRPRVASRNDNALWNGISRDFSRLVADLLISRYRENSRANKAPWWRWRRPARLARIIARFDSARLWLK